MMAHISKSSQLSHQRRIGRRLQTSYCPLPGLSAFLLICLISLPARIYANAPVSTVFSSSPLQEMSLQLEPTDSLIPDGASILLGERLAVSLNLTVTSNATLSNSSVTVEFPAKLLAADNIVSLSFGANLATSQQNFSYEYSYLKIDFGTVASTSPSQNVTDDDVIMVSFVLRLFEPLESLSDLLDINARAEFTAINRIKQNISDSITYAGPAVRSDLQNAGFPVGVGDFLPDRETSLTTSFDFPPYNLTNVTISFELSSLDVANLNVDLTGVTIATQSNHISYTNPTLPAAFSCITNICTLPTLSLGDVYAANGTLTMQISFIIGRTNLAAGDVVLYSMGMSLLDEAVHISSEALTVVLPDLALTASVVKVTPSRTETVADYTFQYVRFTTTVFHTNLSTGPAYEVTFSNPVSNLILDLDTIVPDLSSHADQLSFTSGKSKYTYTPGTLQVGETATLMYEARLTQAAVNENLESNITFTSQFTWKSLPSSESSASHPGYSYGPNTDSVCITQAITYEESLLFNHGLAALFFFLALIITFVLVIVVCFIYAKTSAGGIYSLVRPEETIGGNVAEHGLIINHRAGRTGLDMVEEYSSITANESIVLILVQKDKTKKILEFENLDVMNTITTDIQLEEQRTLMMTEMFLMLLGSWAVRDVLTRDMSQRLTKKYQRSSKDALKKLDDEYRQASRELLKYLSRENQGKLIMMKKKHDAEIRQKSAQARSLEKEDLKEVMALLKKQQASEVSSMTQLLRLKQDEEQEKLRKEFATKKRIAIKSLQQEYLDQAILQGKLDEDQARGLLTEHHQNTATVERLMDEEMSRQRMMLEEKLARRKLLAKATESQAEHHSLVLNTMATQTMSALNELEESEQLSRAEAQAITERLLQEVRGIKEGYERERGRQEVCLHKRISEQKKKRLAEKEKENKEELAEFEKEKKTRVEKGDMDPEEYLEARSSLVASQRKHLTEIETEVDEEAREELEKLRDGMAAKVRSQVIGVKQKLHGDLKNKGLSEKLARELMEQHERDIEELTEQRQEQRDKQERAIKKRLVKQRKELVQRKQEEREEREQIREHEEKMVNRLLASQVAMSEEERRRILAEHEEHLVAMENSLALTKLRQRRLLEEKMAARKNRQMDRLAKKQEQETKRKLRERKVEDSDDDNDAAPSGLKEMMQKHTEERLAVITEQDDDADKLEEEMEAVRAEMLQERSSALKEQEERLGAIMAQLQMEKARELATIEEQQKALMQLKMNMLDELTEKGIMKNAQCKKVIEAHQKQVEAQEQKMRKQRAKAEAEIKRRLQEKVVERERSLALQQEEETQRLLEREKNRTAARFKRVALKQRHIMQMEEFRNKLEIEMAQSLEEIRRLADVQKMKDQQEQDLEFLSALVKVGKYDKMELVNVLHLLFPTKSHDQINELLTKLYEKVDKDGEESDGSPVSRKKGALAGEGIHDGKLEEKVKSAILGQIQENNQRRNSLTKKKKKQKAKALAPLRRPADKGLDHSDNERGNGELRAPPGRGKGGAPLPEISSSKRPEPLGQASDTRRGSRGYDDEESEERSVEEDEEEDYGAYRKGMGDTIPLKPKRGKKGKVIY